LGKKIHPRPSERLGNSGLPKSFLLVGKEGRRGSQERKKGKECNKVYLSADGKRKNPLSQRKRERKTKKS